MIPALTAGILAAICVLSGCKPRQAMQADVKDLNQGQALSPRSLELMDNPEIRAKSVVLVYYANDTYAPTDDDPAHVNKEALLRKIRAGVDDQSLDQTKRDKLSRVAGRISNDWNNFRRVVDQDVKYLQESICKSNPRLNMGLVVFRNFGNDASSARSGNMAFSYERNVSYTYCFPQSQPQTGTLSIPHFDDFRYQSQPLSHPHVFRKAIEEVFKQFPSGNHRYVLITKSHGTREMAIAPHLSVDVRRVADKDVYTAVANGASQAAGLAGGTKDEYPMLEEVNVVLAADEKVRQQLPQAIGVEKKDYLQILYHFGGGDPKVGMFFPIVFMEACKSALGLSRDAELNSVLSEHQGAYSGLRMENVGLLYTSDEKGLAYRTIDFAELFDGFRYRSLSDFQDRIRQFLTDKSTRR